MALETSSGYLCVVFDNNHVIYATVKASYVLAKSSSFTSCEDTEELFPPEPELCTDGWVKMS